MILMAFSAVKRYDNQVHQNGVFVLNAFASVDSVNLYGEETRDYMKYWTALHGVDRASNFIQEIRDVSQWVPAARTRLLICSDPLDASWAVSYGIPALLVCHGKLTLPQYSPDTFSWNTMVEELDRQLGVEPPVLDSEYVDKFE